MKLTVSRIKTVVSRALQEDLGLGDVTTDALIPPGLFGTGSLVVESRGIVAGLHVAEIVFDEVDQGLTMERFVKDGIMAEPGDFIAAVEGRVASILKAERVALNFLQRMSGIATETAKYVEAVKGTNAKILDTRKTTPGLRLFEKYAVKVGGGQNHRQNLGDQVLIKDNHLAALRQTGTRLSQAIRTARSRVPGSLKIEVEVENLDQVREALEGGADIIMLDNMSVKEMRQAVKLTKGQALVEASGGITLQNVRAVAKTGVDFISVGGLTHSPKALDISIEMSFF